MRSGFVTNLERMQFQLQYRGTGLINTEVLTFGKFLDQPQPQLQTIVLPPDPIGLPNARPEAYPSDEAWPRLLENGAPRYMQTKNGTQQAFARRLQYSKYFS